MRFTSQLLVGVLVTLSACASDTAVPAPTSVTEDALSGEQLSTHIPEGWLKIASSNTANLNIAEYVPPDTGEQWQEKLSVEAMQGDLLPDPLEFVAGWASDQAEVCDHFSDHPIFAGFENGYASVVRLLEGGRNKRTGKPLVTMIKVIRGQDALYTVTRIWRLETFDASSGQIKMDTGAIAAWSNHLKQTYVCNPDSTDHPCTPAAD